MKTALYLMHSQFLKTAEENIKADPSLGLYVNDFETVLTQIRDMLTDSDIDVKVWLYGMLCYSEALERTYGGKKANVRTDLG